MPTQSPTAFECSCIFPTPAPTSNPTPAPTPNPTPSPTDAQTCIESGSRCSASTPCCGNCHPNGNCRGGRRALKNVFLPNENSNTNANKKPGGIKFKPNGDIDGKVDRAKLHSDMKAASLKWKQLQKKEYSFEFERVCYECSEESLGPFLITVNPKGQEGSTIVYLESGDNVPLDIKIGLPTTMDDLFDKLERESQSDLSYMNVDYHPSEGYPKRFAMSHFSDKALIMGYIKNVRVLKN